MRYTGCRNDKLIVAGGIRVARPRVDSLDLGLDFVGLGLGLIFITCLISILITSHITCDVWNHGIFL